MAIRKIATLGHPVLRQVARAVSREELVTEGVQRFVDDLVETMRDANGAGLAANQIGLSPPAGEDPRPLRIAAIEVNKNPRYPYKPNWPLTVLVNPVVTPLGEESFLVYEGCLSVPNLRGEVRRGARVRVQGWDRTGADVDFEVRGLTAGTFQHELDHLDGKLFVDRVEDTRTLTTWSDFERFHMAAFVERAHGIVAKYGS